MEQEYIKNPLIGQMTKEAYDLYLELDDKITIRAKYLCKLLGLFNESEIISDVRIYDSGVVLTTYEEYYDDFINNEYEIPAKYLYISDEEVLEDVRKREEAETIQEAENKKIQSIKESLSAVNSNLTQEELTKLAENLYYEIIDN